MRNFDSCPTANTWKLAFLILNQAQGCQSFPRDQQRPNHNAIIAESNFVTTKAIKLIQKNISRGHKYKAAENNFTKIIDHNSKSDFDERVKFVEINLVDNNLSL